MPGSNHAIEGRCKVELGDERGLRDIESVKSLSMRAEKVPCSLYRFLPADVPKRPAVVKKQGR